MKELKIEELYTKLCALQQKRNEYTEGSPFFGTSWPDLEYLVRHYNALNSNDLEKIILFYEKNYKKDIEKVLIYDFECWELSFLLYKKYNKFFNFPKEYFMSLWLILKEVEAKFENLCKSNILQNWEYKFGKIKFFESTTEKGLLQAYYYVMNVLSVFSFPEPLTREKEIEKKYKNKTSKEWHDKYYTLKRKLKKLNEEIQTC